MHRFGLKPSSRPYDFHQSRVLVPNDSSDDLVDLAGNRVLVKGVPGARARGYKEQRSAVRAAE